MPSSEELTELTAESAFIFTGSITRVKASTVPELRVDAHTVVVAVEDVIKSPAGLRGLAGREITVQLRDHLEPAQYVFFAEPLSIGNGIALKEKTHLSGSERRLAVRAVERGFRIMIEERAQAAYLVVLGTLGPVRHLLRPEERFGKVSWAIARLEIERVLKGKKSKHVNVVGPNPGSKKHPRWPALRPGLRAIFLLQRPPDEAVELVPENDRQTLGFIADTFDIQSPEQLDTILKFIGVAE